MSVQSAGRNNEMRSGSGGGGEMNYERMLKEQERRIQKLKDELKHATRWYGRNNTSRKGWSGKDATNMSNLNGWLRQRLFWRYKFLPMGWSDYNTVNPNSLCQRVLQRVCVLSAVRAEQYWDQRLVPIKNKKYVEMRSNINSACRTTFQSM